MQIKIAGTRYISHDKKITFLKLVNDKQEYFRHRLFNPKLKWLLMSQKMKMSLQIHYTYRHQA